MTKRKKKQLIPQETIDQLNTLAGALIAMLVLGVVMAFFILPMFSGLETVEDAVDFIRDNPVPETVSP